MFDFGFSELVVIGIVMLIVVGPERLPKVARTAGHLLGRVQRYVSDVKSDIQREMQLEELKKLQEQVRHQAQEIESTVRSGVADVESGVGQAAEEVRSILPASAPALTTPCAAVRGRCGGSDSGRRGTSARTRARGSAACRRESG
jgi:sec-independent protein translocase protein TatB